MNAYNEEVDLSLAIQLQAQFEEELRIQRKKEEEKRKSLDIVGHKWNAKWMSLPEPEQEKLSISLVDPCWEYLDPNPNIYDLFLTFNHQFFWGRLMGVEVKWSPRMTLCAGVCSYEGRGGLCSVRLSTPLLKLRPRKDLIDTLLHEMIHAYLFVTHNNKDHDAHGPQFHDHMFRINKLAGTNITVYHSFHDEVAVYRQHIWKCDGPCRKRPPYYGLVKRSMNRAPSARDFWWASHAQSCGGSYTKIKEPEGYGDKKAKRKIKDESVKDIRNYFPTSGVKRPKSLSGKENSGGASTLGGSNTVGLPKSSSSNDKSGNVKHVDVQNTSNSNVHGFGKQNAQNSKNSGKSNSHGGKNFYSGSTMNAIPTSSGSRTIVVKNKKPPGTEVKEKESGQTGSTFSSFFGTGHVLGSSTLTHKGKSRLLAQYDRPARNAENGVSVTDATDEDIPDRKDGKTDTSPSPDAKDPMTTCPLCQVSIDSDDFEEHIGECLGDFDADPDFDSDVMPGQSTSPNPRTENNNTNYNFSNNNVNRNTDKLETSDECITLFSDDEKDSNNVMSAAASSSKAENSVVFYPCPICNESCDKDSINAHVNKHFS